MHMIKQDRKRVIEKLDQKRTITKSVLELTVITRTDVTTYKIHSSLNP